MIRPNLGMDHLLNNYKVEQLVLNEAPTVEDGTPLKTVLFTMRNLKIGSILTVRGKKLTGIFTEHDFMKVVTQGESWDAPIEQVASPKPWVVQNDAGLKEVIQLMKEKNIRHVPVLDKEGALKGVLSIRSVIKLFAEHFPADVMNLPPRLHKNAKTPEGG